jgi:hypothetical protein
MLGRPAEARGAKPVQRRPVGGAGSRSYVHHKPGDKVRSTEPVAQSVSTPGTVLRAALAGLLRGQGSGAPGIGRASSVVAVVGALLCVMGFAAVPALAAAPESPEVRVEFNAIKATETTFTAVLDPNGAAGEPLMYKFYYAVGASCMGGLETLPLSAAGNQDEEHGELVKGLTPDTGYTVCVVAEDLLGTATSKAVHFKTSLPPEKPVGLEVPAGEITATTATMKGELNPNNAGEPAHGIYEYPLYLFYYKVSPLAAPPTGECEENTWAGAATGAKAEEVSSEVQGLEPNAKYQVCMAARNVPGEEAKGTSVVTFTTHPAPPTVEWAYASPVKAKSTTFHAGINPNNQQTSYEFLYATNEKLENAKSIPGAGTIEGWGGPEVVVQTGEVLAPATTYYYQVVAKNKSGEEQRSGVQSFKTTAAALPEVPQESALYTRAKESVGLYGLLNPNAAEPVEPGTYQFLYKATTTPSKAECESGTKVPATPGVYNGGGPEWEYQSVSGLTPDTAYVFCLAATNASGTTVGPPVAFTTALPPEKPDAPVVEAGSLTATTVTLKSTLNPANAGEPGGSYQYLYQASATKCESEGASPGVGPLAGAKGETVSSEVTGLRPKTQYTVCTSAINAVGEAEVGPSVTFTTLAAARAETPAEEQASEVGGQSATLKGVLNPKNAGEAGHYEFLYRRDAKQDEPEKETGGCEGGSRAPEPAGVDTGALREPVSVALSKLLPGSEYTFCLVAINNAGEQTIAPPVIFTTSALGEEFSSTVTAKEATLNAEVGTDDAETTFHIEYGASSISEVSTPTAHAIPSQTPLIVGQTVLGLKPATTYHYRFVVSNERGTVVGVEHAFTTAPAPGSELSQNCSNEQRRTEQPYALRLPDCRAYEMVSPLNSDGQDANDSFEYAEPPRAAVSGNAVAYASFGNFAEPKGSAYETTFVSRRGPEGWSTQEVTPIHNPTRAETTPSFLGTLFTPELTAGIASTSAALTPEAQLGDDLFNLYVQNFENNSYQYVGSEYLAFPKGASTDLSHVAIGTSEWVEGKVFPVTVGNHGEAISARIGAYGEYLYAGGDLWHAVSSDGSRVFFSNSQVYVRVNVEKPQSPTSGGKCTVAADACTIEVSASQKTNGSGPNGTDPHGPQSAQYLAASADGSKVFFTSTAELTNDAYTGPDDNASNLYEYELSGEPGVPGRLTDLSVDDSGNGAEVQGVVQVSEDGSYVYFVAEGDLGGDATPGAPNLYVSHDGGAPTFIATLDAGIGGDPINDPAVVSPSGAYLAFESTSRLTSYDNMAAASRECSYEGPPVPCQEIYLYDAQTGSLACASCDPTGAAPIGSASFRPYSDPSWEDYRQHNLAENGTLFFDSSDALVPNASDGRLNVYEYEDGHIHALSDVAGGFESYFMDASPDGSNVFVATADQLLPEDTSNNVVIWDARVGGGYPVTASPPQCDNGDSCKPPPTPQPAVLGVPASATFSGPGDLIPTPSLVEEKPSSTPKAVKCAKGKRLSNGRCVKEKKKPKKQKRSKSKTTNKRRAGR